MGRLCRLIKLEILTSLSCKDNTQALLRELQTYIKDSNEKFVCTSVRVAGQLADADPAVSNTCMEGVMHLLLCANSAPIVRECVVTLRQLLQQNTKSATSFKILRQLAKLLIIEGGMEEPMARSSIVWLVGEFHHVLGDACPDILRILAAGFVQECTETKTQILNLAIKLSLQMPDDNNVQLLMTYVLEMARYDVDTDLRDRSRFMTALMGLAPSSEGEAGAAEVDEDALSELNEHAKSKYL
jgi:AP-3 complex subunit beta